MKLNKQQKALLKALIATETKPLKKQIEYLEYQVECAESKALNLEAKLKDVETSRDNWVAKHTELASVIKGVKMELYTAEKAREAAEERANKLAESCRTFKPEWVDFETATPKSDEQTRNVLVRLRRKITNGEWCYSLHSGTVVIDTISKDFEYQWCYLD